MEKDNNINDDHHHHHHNHNDNHKQPTQQQWDQNSTNDLQSLEGLGKRHGGSCCYGSWTVIMAILVRLVLVIHAGIAVWLVVSLTSNTLLWTLLAALALMLAEAVYTVVKRRGRESRWVCPCFLAYLACVLPPIWLVELDRLKRFNEALDSSNNLTSLVAVNGLTVPVRLEPEVWVSVMEQALLFLLVLGRWLLPRGDISRSQLSQLLFVFMGIASDNMELFELFDETEVRKDPVLTYVILAVWSMSLLQFVLVLTSTRSPRKAQVVHDHATAEQEARSGGRSRRSRRKRGLCEIIFATEIWSLVFSILVQDGPYAATRIYTLLKYDLLTYSIIFFICKNLLVICLVIYRLIIICVLKCNAHDRKKKGDDDDDDDDEEEAEIKAEMERRNRRLLPNAPRSSKVGSLPRVAEPMPLGALPSHPNATDA